MFLFLHMVLAHFIADYPLQTDRIYCYKLKHLKGQLLHAGIHFIVFFLFLLPYLGHSSVWIYLLIVTFSHLLIDILKVSLIDKTKLNQLATYTLDQVFHIGVAATVFFFPFVREIPQASPSPLFSWYWDETVIAFLIGLIFASYFTTYFLACWQDMNKELEHDDGYILKPFQKYYGMVERGLLMSLVVLVNGWGILFIPVLVALRFPVYKWLKQIGKKLNGFLSLKELLVGSVFSVVAGLIIRIFVLSQS